MCRVRATPTAAANQDISNMNSNMDMNKSGAMLNSSSLRSSAGLRVLICSENVPPQVNGIARRVGMYADGLRNLGCDVGEFH